MDRKICAISRCNQSGWNCAAIQFRHSSLSVKKWLLFLVLLPLSTFWGTFFNTFLLLSDPYSLLPSLPTQHYLWTGISVAFPSAINQDGTVLQLISDTLHFLSKCGFGFLSKGGWTLFCVRAHLNPGLFLELLPLSTFLGTFLSPFFLLFLADPYSPKVVEPFLCVRAHLNLAAASLAWLLSP